MKKKKECNYGKKIKLLIIMFSLIISSFITYKIIELDILPNKYLITSIAIILIMDIIAVIVLLLTKFNKIGYALAILNIIIFFFGIYYISSANSFLNKKFGNKKLTEENIYYVVTNKNNNYTELDIKEDISYYKETPEIDKAFNTLSESYNIAKKEYDDIIVMYNDLLNNTNMFMLVEKSSHDIVFELDKKLVRDNFEIIYEFKIETKIEKPVEPETTSKEVYNIYLAGTDFTNSLVDFNMIITINTKTNKILITSMPRDYYIEVAGKGGRKDTLSYMGPYGINTSVKSLENLFDIKIDYYVKMKAEVLVDLVDTIDGINYCSNMSYTTSHALVLNTYVDKGKKLHVKKGCQHLNGIETLTVARERNAFVGRDRVRQENCRKIMLAILDRLKSTNTLIRYNDILNSLDNLYETSLPRDVVSSFVKRTLDGSYFEIIEQSLDGSDTIDYVHLTNLKDWVMYPSESSVENAKQKLKEIMNENDK